MFRLNAQGSDLHGAPSFRTKPNRGASLKASSIGFSRDGPESPE